MDMFEFAPEKSAVEWPTVVLAAAIYALWFGLTYGYESLPIWVLLPFGAWTIAWHMSLQHEIIHGHPTRVRWINTALGTWPLTLWLPYEVYRRSHLQHHNDSRLTDPLDDPESYYWTQRQWDELGWLQQRIVRAQSTLLGRITIGPGWAIYRFWNRTIALWAAGDRTQAPIVIRHALEVAVVLFWVVGVCHMPLWLYVVCFAYPGTGLALVRSFAEHRAAGPEERRTAIVENSWFFGVLFLFNNLHVAHHMRARMPWYRLPKWYRMNREALIERNGGLLYAGYADVARRYFLRPHDQPLHPMSSDRF